MKEKKGNKGKKSLVDLKNFRSTRLKELTFGAKSLGASSTSIQTTSNSVLPLYQNFINKEMCSNFVEYNGFYKEVYISRYNKILRFYYETLKNKNLLMPLENLVDGGVYYYNNGYSTFTSFPFNGQSGYLFIYLRKSDNICNKCINYIEEGCPDGFESDQNEGFVVLFNRISQINAFNRTMSSSGVYLSNIINNALNSVNSTITSVINDIRSRNDNDTTPIIPHDPANPLILDYEYINLSCLPNTLFYINDEIIPRYYSFKVNQNTFLPESEAKKLTFDDIKLIGGWNGFLTVEAELNYNKGDPTIQFKQTGSSTITFRNLYFEDTENISGNPNGPRFYGPKYFTLRINATVNPAP